MNKQRLLELAGITEAQYAGNQLPSDLYIVKVMWVSEDHDIPTHTVGPFKNEGHARHFEDQIMQIDPDMEYIYSTEVDTLGFDFDPDEFLEELQDMV
jgi:hypothetical protein